MEGKTKVKVKFGKTMYSADGERDDAAIIAAKVDAITRLVTRFPKVENIETETRISYSCDPNIKGKMGVKASASGYVPKGKNSTRHIIKDIKTTKLYQAITKELEEANATVVEYAFKYMKKHRHVPSIEFNGKGGIPWEQLKDYINSNNQVEIDTGARKKDLFIINPNELYIDLIRAKGFWEGYILLSDGSWLELKKSYCTYDRSYYNSIERYSPPKLNLSDSNLDSNFEVTFHKGD